MKKIIALLICSVYGATACNLSVLSAQSAQTTARTQTPLLLIAEIKLGEILPVAQQPEREFVALHNPGNADVQIAGAEEGQWTLQYLKQSATPAQCDTLAWPATKILEGTIAADGALVFDFSASPWLSDNKDGSLRLIHTADDGVATTHDVVGWGSTPFVTTQLRHPCLPRAKASDVMRHAMEKRCKPATITPPIFLCLACPASILRPQ